MVYFAALYVALSVFSFMKNEQILQGVFSAVAILATSAFILSFNMEIVETKLILLLINGAAWVVGWLSL